MKNKKTKLEILDEIVLKDLSNEISRWINYWYYLDDDDYSCGDFFSDECCSQYEYLPEYQQPESIDYISRRGIITTHKYSHGKLINMETVYSKEIMRQKKLEAILDGKFSVVSTKTYLFDIISKESKNNLDNIK
jgi:hypothetical protein